MSPPKTKDQYETFPLLATMYTNPPTENEREPMSLAMSLEIDCKTKQNKRELSVRE